MRPQSQNPTNENAAKVDDEEDDEEDLGLFFMSFMTFDKLY